MFETTLCVLAVGLGVLGLAMPAGAVYVLVRYVPLGPPPRRG